ncbi:MAG TPA: low affinity iron permease family protein [Candidatus Paceibacterota bacterium]|nr:low affinity iron permease family protein [Candidatus Paceibacterota bacterium]
MNDLFRVIAHKTSKVMGSPWAFLIAIGVVALWAGTGWLFNFSNTWQLVINTGTTIVTFLMVFLIQNTQNRDAHATHLKLDELIKALDPADNQLIDIEDDTDERMSKLEDEFKKFKEEHQH